MGDSGLSNDDSGKNDMLKQIIEMPFRYWNNIFTGIQLSSFSIAVSSSCSLSAAHHYVVIQRTDRYCVSLLAESIVMSIADLLRQRNKSLHSVIFPVGQRTKTSASGMMMILLFYLMTMPIYKNNKAKNSPFYLVRQSLRTYFCAFIFSCFCYNGEDIARSSATASSCKCCNNRTLQQLLRAK